VPPVDRGIAGGFAEKRPGRDKGAAISANESG
jgi:hypothetical protein